MIRRIASSRLWLVALLLAPAPSLADAAGDYAAHCAACHGEHRLGGTGPALIPETLGRVKGIAEIIAQGRPLTQMAGFAEQLAPAQIEALEGFIKTPLDQTPHWTPEDIAASREMAADYRPAAAPVFDADPMNITLVVETGDHHVSVLDGDRLEVLDRFATPYAVHGGPKFSPDGRYVFIMSRDGWVQKYDIWSLREVGRIRAGLNSRNIAMSHDGRWLAVANSLPQTLTILSTETLEPVRVIEVAGRDGTPSRVSAVYQAPQRKSFILALKDAPEIWEIATDPDAGPFHDGYVHSHEKGMEEAFGAQQGLFARRRIPTDEPLDDFFFDPGYRNLIGTNREGTKGVVINLTTGARVAELPLPGMPHLGSGITWDRAGHKVMATPHLNEGVLSVIDMTDWTLVKQIRTDGPGFFLRSHETSDYVWADVFMGPNRDEMHVIDKQTLKIVRTLKPAPGRTAAHTEFTRDGRYALVSIWEEDGAVVVYDAKTLEEVKRLPMRKPSGKYNIWNKITFSDGTSH
ncbi:Cytochrome c, mono-and diheme variants [Paracoccus aminovorans]|uniref:Cytochrome c, mono-and diheme variants n=1 Tax=Paracoccus aminovorans TaxID=34004 RepID=A0A1I3AFM6_9RHOB|nr:cytochrome D1 domain-containing protein [Paracoccus aminovorans]CQR84160.1 nitrite reductase N [Paracoccus aminovorans]SFH48656.1 Cytochrome c, mono-and diheme variants [Paracoccus aminovorans]